LLNVAVIDTVETKSFNNIEYFISFLFLSNASLLLIDLKYGFASGDINPHRLSYFFDILTTIKNSFNDLLPDLFSYLFITASLIFLGLAHALAFTFT